MKSDQKLYPKLDPENIHTPLYTPVQPRTQESNETVHVFCRLRPTEKDSCIKVISDTTVQLTPPETAVNYRSALCKEYQCSFKKVFSEANSQKEIFNTVALPLVENLILGKNGLLFTYGVTGSGKTYTMTGVPEDVGIMPRCFDVLFNSIAHYQAKRFVFKPDKMNGFDVQSEKDAERELEQWLKNNAKFGELKNKGSQENLTCARSKDDTKIPVPDEDNAFAVFVTYIEVYNKNVYDLLDNTNENHITARRDCKFLRADSTHNSTYVLGVNEIEVKNAEEACEVFYRGQKRKRMAHTALNTESSRSHSIFTIRLVQAPLDINGEYVFQDKKEISISQLSLVDLAGSERTNRTNNVGQRLREAGSINNSLMTLRTCLEILRENQKTGAQAPIPFRESKLTHLFRNFFDGQGDIRMIVCVNPRVEDYDETVQVMRFAEVSQEILVKPTPVKTEPPVGLTPGRRRLNMLQRKNLQCLEEIKENTPQPAYIPNDAEMIYSLEPFPLLENIDPLDGECNKNLMRFLKERIEKKEQLLTDLHGRADKFRGMLLEREETFFRMRQDYEAVNAAREHEQLKIKNLEDRVISLTSEITSWKRKYDQAAEENKRLKRELDSKDNKLHLFSIEKDREKRVNQKIAAKSEKLAKEKENTIKEKKQIEMQLKDKEKRLRLVKKALAPQNEHAKVNVVRSDDCDTETETIPSSNEMEVQYPETPVLSHQESQQMSSAKSTTTTTSTAVSNLRYGRTFCDEHDQWLDHRAAVTAPLNTVLQPVLKRRRSFTSVTSPKDVTKVSKYCLLTQNQDENGSVETQIFKGDVVPTCGGGAQIIFNDVETLKQTSPVTSPSAIQKVTSPVTSPLKEQNKNMNPAVAASSTSSLYPDITTRCAVSVEGHSLKRK